MAIGLAVLVCLHAPPARAEQPSVALETPADGASIGYRQIFVPADDVAAWPLGAEKYLPIDARQFQGLVAAANDMGNGAARLAEITEANYLGRTGTDRVVAGTGSWKIELHGNGPVVLPLGQTMLVVRNARWRDEPLRKVRLGRWGRGGSLANDLGLEVPRSGVLEFDWQLPQIAQLPVAAPWRLPLALTNRLILDLPSGYRPIVEGGVVKGSTALGPESPANSNLRRWEIALGPPPLGALRIAPTSGALLESMPEIAVREDSAYRLNERGMEISARLSFDAAESRPREIVLPLPKGLHLMSVQVDGSALAWRVFARGPARTPTAIIEIPEVSGQSTLSVTLRAWQPLVLGRAWVLPKLRPDNVFWTSGKIELSVASALELERLTATGCVQTGVVPLTDEGTGTETCQLAAYSPNASVEVTIAHRKPKVSIRQGTSLSLLEPILNGRLTTNLDVSQGAVHALIGDIAPGWSIESVQTMPAGSLGEWFVTTTDENKELHLQLSQAASPARKITITVSARLQRADQAKPLSADTLRLVHWRDAHVVQHLVAFQAPEPYSAEPIGNLALATPKQLGGESSALLDHADGENRIFDLTTAEGAGGLQVVEKLGRFDADLCLDATLSRQNVQQTWRLQIQPQSGRIDQVLVFANRPLGENVLWTDASTGRALAANRLGSDDARRERLPASGEAWLVHLPQPTAKQIDIAAAAVLPLARRTEMALLCVPDSERQQGRVQLHAPISERPQLEFERMRRVPRPIYDGGPTASGDASSVLAAYAYEPSRIVATTNCPRLWIGPSEPERAPGLIARQAEFESFFASDGRVVHRAEFQLELDGTDEFLLRPPLGAEQPTISLNGRVLESSAGGSGAGPIRIHLPGSDRTATLAVHFEARQPPLTAGTKLKPPLFEGIRLLSGGWTVWLPEQFAPVGTDLSPVRGALSWRRRLFGPVGRAADSSLFRPFHGSDWVSLAATTSDAIEEPIESPGLRANDRLPAIESTGTRSSNQQAGPARATRRSRAGQEPPRYPAGSGNISALGIPTASVHGPSLDGWQVYRTAFVAASPEQVTLAYPPRSTASAIAALLVCLVAGGRLAARQGPLYVTLVAASAACALLLPAAFVPIATGMFLGLLLSLILVWPAPRVSDETPTKTWRRATAGGIVALAATLALAGRALAQTQIDAAQGETPTSAGEDTQVHDADARAGYAMPIHRVLIPADAEGHGVGTKWYVSEELLRALFELARRDSMSGHDWLLLDAVCEGELRARSAPGIAAGDWKLTLSIDVLARDTTIALPLVRSEANWPEAAVLDGIPTPVVWHPDGVGCQITVTEPGQYELAFSFQPRIRASTDQDQIALTLPQVHGRSILHYPAQISEVTVRGVGPAQPGENTPGLLASELDGSGRLAIRWPQVTLHQDEAQGLRVTELQWLSIDGSDARLDTKFVVEGSARRPDSLAISFDRSWELLSSGNGISSVPGETGSRESVRVVLSPNEIDRQEVKLHWRLLRPVTLGNFKLPPIALASLPVGQRWLGVSSDLLHKCEVLGERSPSTGTNEEFLAAWGDAPVADESSLVVARLKPSGDTIVSVQPRTTETAVSDAMHVAATDSGLRTLYQADVVTSGFAMYSLPLTTSAQILVDEVSMTQGGKSLPLRWSRPTESTLHIFFSQGMSDGFRLTVLGHVPPDASRSYELPRISAGETMQLVQLYRQDNVLVKPVGLDAGEPADQSPAAPPILGEARLVGSYQVSPEAFSSVRLQVAPNNLGFAGETLIALTREADDWWAGFTCHLQVERGELGTLRLRAPANWVGPLDIQSDVAATVDMTTGENKQSLVVIHLKEPVVAGKTLALRLRGRLSTEVRAPIAVPQIVLENAVQTNYVLVPKLVDTRPADWTEFGVRAATLPRALWTKGFEPAAWKCFKFEGSNWRVSLRASAAERAIARVRLADTRAALGPFGGQLLVTRLVVVSPDLTDAVLELPANQELVAVTTDGSPALLGRLDSRRWRLPLGPAPLPQWVEIVSRSARSELPNGEQLELSRPRLLAGSSSIPVEVSLWSIAQAGPSSPNVHGAAVVTAREQAALRLDRLVSITEAATSTAVDLAAPEGRDWCLPWAARLKRLREQALATLGQSSGARELLEVAPSSEEQLRRASGQVDAWLQQCDEIFGEQAAGGSHEVSSEPAQSSAWELAPQVADEWLYCVAEGEADRLAVDLAPSVAPLRQIHVRELLVVIALAVATLALMRRRTAWDSLWRWPHALSFLLGLAYWAWLVPSWLGLAIAAVSAWLALRPGWPGLSLRRESSTVLRAPPSS